MRFRYILRKDQEKNTNKEERQISKLEEEKTCFNFMIIDDILDRKRKMALDLQGYNKQIFLKIKKMLPDLIFLEKVENKGIISVTHKE